MCKKNKLRVYRELKEDFECKYLDGVSDMGYKLMLRFRFGTHGLNEELGIDILLGRIVKFVFYECESEFVDHVLWEYSKYSSICMKFISNFDGILQNDFHLKVII